MTIVSHRHGFAFIKTHKTAGTSIEIDLAARLEHDAIVTPILPPVPGHEPRNHLGPDGQPKFRNHMTAAELRDALGADAFKQLHVFCVEREPVAKCLSHFHMLKVRVGPGGLSNADREALTWPGYLNAGNFPIDDWRYEDPEHPGALLVDQIIAYDELTHALPALMHHLGINDFKLTARAKSEYSRTPVIHPDQVTPEQRATIYARFERALALSGMDQRWRV